MKRRNGSSRGRRPRVLVIGGVDPSGGAGLAVDLRVLASLGVHGQVVASLVTEQSASRLHAVHPLAPGILTAQLQGLTSRETPDVVKIGALGSAGTVRAVARWIEARPRIPVVADPVLAASRGLAFLDGRGVRAWIREILPAADLVTPNLREAAILSSSSIRDEDDRRRAGRTLLAAGARAVLIKGGHGRGDRVADWLVTSEGERSWTSRRLPGAAVRGTGCALATAIAARLARGGALVEAVEDARVFVRRAIRRARPAGGGGVRFLHLDLDLDTGAAS